MSKYYWIIIALCLIVLIVIGIDIHLKSKFSIVTINGHQFNVDIAATEQERETGLMNRTHLDEKAGMLFVFPQADTYAFWMKNTLIPLDIIWINEGKIVNIQTLQPQTDSNIPQYAPKQKADRVLEINAGLSQKYNFRIGDSVLFN